MPAEPTDEAIQDLADVLDACTLTPGAAIAAITSHADPRVALRTFCRLLNKCSADVREELIAIGAGPL